jgi:hypothetical protein
MGRDAWRTPLNDYFQGSIRQLINRGRLLLTKIPQSLPREFYLLEQDCRKRLGNELDDLEALLNDPDMQLPALQPERLRKFRRAVWQMDFLEAAGLVVLNRANEEDKHLNAVVEGIRREIHYPLLPPVVTLLSQNYYYIQLELNVLCLPLGEGDSLLHLPDLYHELGHPLLNERHDPRVDPFQSGLLKTLELVAAYTEAELERESRRRGPQQFSSYLRQWLFCWAQSWGVEFFCDLFAVYTVGPAFGWANLHLCAKRGDEPFKVPTSASAPNSHPADNARMRAMLHGLRLIGFSKEADSIQERWQQLIRTSGSVAEPEYSRCFPDAILQSMAKLALDGVAGMGCHIASQAMSAPIYLLLNEAWTEFWRDPGHYTRWEETAVQKLREYVS